MSAFADLQNLATPKWRCTKMHLLSKTKHSAMFLLILLLSGDSLGFCLFEFLKSMWISVKGGGTPAVRARAGGRENSVLRCSISSSIRLMPLRGFHLTSFQFCYLNFHFYAAFEHQLTQQPNSAHPRNTEEPNLYPGLGLFRYSGLEPNLIYCSSWWKKVSRPSLWGR